MPLIRHDDLINSTNLVRTKDINTEAVTRGAPDHDIFKILGAAFRQENEVVSLINNGIRDRYIEDPNFDRFSQLKGTKYGIHAEKFIYADNQEEVDRIKDMIDTKESDERIMQESGVWGMLSAMAAGTLSPTLLLPGGAAVRAAKLSKMIGTAGLKAAGYGALAVGLQEAVLQGTQDVRDPDRLVEGAFYGALLGGVFGASFKGLSLARRKYLEGAVRKIDKTGEDLLSRIDDDLNVSADRSASAASASDIGGINVKQDEGLAHFEFILLRKVLESTGLDKTKLGALVAKANKSGKLFEQTVKFISSPIPALRSPTIQGLTSRFSLIRKMTNESFDHNFILGKNVAGSSSGVTAESYIKAGQRDLMFINKAMVDDYFVYLGMKEGGGQLKAATAHVMAKQKKTMSFKEFNKAVAEAMLLRHDFGEAPKVMASAKRFRSYINKLYRQMQKHGITEKGLEDVDLDTSSYFTHVYNVDKIVKERDQVVDLFRRKFMIKNNKLSYDEATDAANKSVDNILGQGDRSLAMHAAAQRLVGGGKSTKHRVLDIDSADLAPYLVLDAQSVMSNYIHHANSLIAVKKMLNNMGVDSLSDLKVKLREEAAKMSSSTKDPKVRAKIHKELEEAQQFAEDTIGSLLGLLKTSKSSKWNRGLRTLRKYQTMAFLQGVTLSSMPDTTMPIFRHGMTRAITKSYRNAIRSISDSNMSTRQLKAMGVGLELEENNILKALSDGDFDMGINRSKLESLTDEALQMFGKVTGMSYWNVWNKRMVGHMSADFIVDTINKAVKSANIDTDVRLAASKHMKSMAERGVPERLYRSIRTDLQAFPGKRAKTIEGAKKKLTEAGVPENLQDGLIKEIEDFTPPENKLYTKELQKDIEKLASLGIGKEHYATIQEQMKRFGDISDDINIPNWDLWSDPNAKRLFASALVKDVDTTILTPGRGDIPFMVQKSEVAATVFQFKSFSSTATNRVLIKGLQQRDANTLMGMMSLAMMGAATYALKMKLSGNEPSDDIDTLLWEGIQRSGLLGLTGDYTAALGSQLGFFDASSRFSGHQAVDTLFGPSLPFIRNGLQGVAGVTDGEIDEKDADKIKKTLPLMTNHPIKKLFDRIAD